MSRLPYCVVGKEMTKQTNVTVLVTPGLLLCAWSTWQLKAAKFKFLISAQDILHFASHEASAPFVPLEFLLLSLCNEMCGWLVGRLVCFFAWGDGLCARESDTVLNMGCLLCSGHKGHEVSQLQFPGFAKAI